MLDSVHEIRRRHYARTILGAKILYPAAIIIALLNVYVAIAVYILVPLLYVFLPKATLGEHAA